MKLQPFLELGKQITGSPLCEIDITDGNYEWVLAEKETDFQAFSRGNTIYDDSLRKNNSHEIEDLSKDSRYKDLYYVKGIPYLRHYFGVKLTTSAGNDIGTISVLDPITKRITKEQKVQFKLLAHAIMMTIESESSHHNISGELDSLKKNLYRLNHDVRSPVNGITGLVDLLIEDKEEISVRTQDILMIKQSAQSIVDIITGALADGNLEINKENFLKRKPLSDVIEEIEKLFNPLAKNKTVTLSLTNKTDHKIAVPYDFSIKLLRIIGNLVSNAIKFSPENETVEVILDDNKKNPVILDITVKNSGESMSTNQIISFTSGDVVARTNGQGGETSFGLGLQHVYQMVTEEGGRVGVEKGDVSGTTFSIILPIPKVDKKQEKKPVHDPFVDVGYAKPTVNGKKITPDLKN